MTKATQQSPFDLLTDAPFGELLAPALQKKADQCFTQFFRNPLTRNKPYLSKLGRAYREGLSEKAMDSIQTILLEKTGRDLTRFLEKAIDESRKKAATEAILEIAHVLGIAAALVNGDPEELSQETLQQNSHFMLTHAANIAAPLFDKLCEALDDGSIEALDKVKNDAAKVFTGSVEPLAKMSEAIPMVLETQEPYRETREDDGTKVRNLARYEFTAPKTKGNEAGIMAKKKAKEGDTPVKKKYTHQWMIKKQSPGDCVTEKLTADIGRFFAPDAFPKIHLVSNNDRTQLYLASRFIEGFEDAWDMFADIHQGNIKKKQEVHDAAFTQIPGMERPWATNVLAGNFDMHSRNVGKNATAAAVVDLGKGLQFRVGYDAFSRSPQQIPGSSDLVLDEPFLPAEMVRCLHGGHYQINSSLFLNEGYIAALEEIVAKIEADPTAFKHAIHSSAKEVQHACAHLNGEDRETLGMELKKIAAEATLDNLHEVLPAVLMERKEMVKEFALHLRLQVALRDNDVETLSGLLDTNPGLHDTPIKWLTEENGVSEYHPASTLKEFAETKKEHLSPEMLKAVGITEEKIHTRPRAGTPVSDTNVPQETLVQPAPAARTRARAERQVSDKDIPQETREERPHRFGKLKAFVARHLPWKEKDQTPYVTDLFTKAEGSHVASFRYSEAEHAIRLRFDSDKARNQAERRLKKAFPEATITTGRTALPNTPLLFIRTAQGHPLDTLAQEATEPSQNTALPMALLTKPKETIAYFAPNKNLGVESFRYHAGNSRITLKFETREQRAEAKHFFEKTYPKAILEEKRTSNHHKPLLCISGDPYVATLAEREATRHLTHVEKLQQRAKAQAHGNDSRTEGVRGITPRSLSPEAIKESETSLKRSRGMD